MQANKRALTSLSFALFNNLKVISVRKVSKLKFVTFFQHGFPRIVKLNNGRKLS